MSGCCADGSSRGGDEEDAMNVTTYYPNVITEGYHRVRKKEEWLETNTVQARGLRGVTVKKEKPNKQD